MRSVSKIQLLPTYIACIVTIVVMPSIMDPINVPKMLLLAICAGLTLGIFWREFSNLWEQTSRPLLLIASWFVFALALTAIFSPQSFFRSVVGVWGRNNGSLTYFSLLVLFLAVASQKSLAPSVHIIKVLSVLGFCSGVYGVLQSLGLDPITWDNPGNKIILTLGNSNFAAAFIALTTVATMGYLFKFAQSNIVRLLLVASYLTQMYVIMKSEALQGLIISILGSGLTLGFLLSFSKVKFVKRLGMAWWFTFAITCFAGLLSVFAIGPLASTLSPYLGSLRDRFYHWIAAINMMKDHLFFGVGIDSFGDYYRLNRIQAAIDIRGTATTGTNNAHNTFLQIGATGGIILLSAYLALTLFITYRAVVALKIQEDKVLVGVLFSIWVAFQVQSFVSIDQIGLVVWGWVLGGCIVSISYYIPVTSGDQRKFEKTKNSQKDSSKRFTNLNLLVTVIGLIPSMMFSPVLVNELMLRNRIVDLVSSISQDEAAFRAQTVVKVAQDSKQPELRLQAINYLLAMKQNDAALFLALLNNKEFPDSYESWDATAQIYEGLGDKERAIYPRQRSVELDPLNLEIKKLLKADQVKN